VLNVAPRSWGLTGSEQVVFRTLAKTGFATREHLLAALYAGRDKPVSTHTLDVFVHRVRSKLEPHGIAIDVVWGEGYVLRKGWRERLRERIESE
jgi:DNA-binding response OmpR family regulator